MKSVKPGRGPSAMNATGSVAVGIFGVFWTIGAAKMGAPLFFVAFGVVFVGLAIVQAIYHYKNATTRNRMSLLDITEAHEEPDPLDSYLKKSSSPASYIHEAQNEDDVNYCPYCGNKVANDDYLFCSRCGKEIKHN